MSISSVPRNALNGGITLADGTAPPVTLQVPFAGGDLKLAGLAPVLNEAIAVEDGRGHHMGLVFGGRTYPTFSFTGKVTDLSGAAAPGSLADFILFRAAYSANVSTTGTGPRPKTIKVVVAYEGTDLGAAADGQVTLNDCLCTIDFQEAKEGNTFSIQGTVYGAITGDLACAQIA